MIREIEEISMNAWPSLQIKLYDGWILRFSNGYTKRANSVNPIYESIINLDEKIDFCEKEYSKRKLPTVFKLTEESKPEGIDKKLEERGYSRCGETSLRIMDMKKYCCSEAENVVINNKYTDQWLEGFFHCSDIFDEKVQSVVERILNNIQGTVIYATKQADGRTAGCGYGAIERGYIGIFDIVVHKDYRGNGYGKDILNGILGAALQLNIKKAYLQVTAGNTPAERLYDKLGFTELYKYWYRKL